MLELDFSNIFKDAIVTQKAVSKTSKRRNTKKKKAEEILHLGNIRRLAKLPDEVTLEFLGQYKENLDDLLYPYVANHVYTVSYANAYEEAIIHNIFGNEKHLGIFQFLKDKNVDNRSDKELVAYAESLLMKGWHIVDEGGKYWLYNGDFQRVLDLTGAASLAKDAASLTFDPGNAHIFIEDGIASKIHAVAEQVGQSADDLAGTGSLDLLLGFISDAKFAGYILNYNTFRHLLEKPAKYATLTEGITMSDLYEQEFRLDNKLVAPLNKRLTIHKGTDSYILFGITPELNQPYVINKDLARVIASNIKDELFKTSAGVINQSFTEIKELRHTFALMTKYIDSDAVRMSYADVVDSFSRLERYTSDGSVHGKFYTKVTQDFAAIAVTEAILLGNYNFSLASIGFDPISGKFYSYTSRDEFTTKMEALDFLINNAQEGEPDTKGFFEPFLGEMFPFRPDSRTFAENVDKLIKNLPSDYLRALSSVEFNTDEYTQDFVAARNYFEKARSFILERAK